MNRYMGSNWTLWQFITITWVILIRETAWLIVTQSAVGHGSGQNGSFLCLLDLAILNGYMPLSSCGGKEMSHRYSLRLSEEHAGIGWTRMVAGEL